MEQGENKREWTLVMEQEENKTEWTVCNGTEWKQERMNINENEQLVMEQEEKQARMNSY